MRDLSRNASRQVPFARSIEISLKSIRISEDIRFVSKLVNHSSRKSDWRFASLYLKLPPAWHGNQEAIFCDLLRIASSSAPSNFLISLPPLLSLYQLGSYHYLQWWYFTGIWVVFTTFLILLGNVVRKVVLVWGIGFLIVLIVWEEVGAPGAGCRSYRKSIKTASKSSQNAQI